MLHHKWNYMSLLGTIYDTLTQKIKRVMIWHVLQVFHQVQLCKLPKMQTGRPRYSTLLLSMHPRDYHFFFFWVQLLSSGQVPPDPFGYGSVSSLEHVFISQRVQWHWPLDTSCIHFFFNSLVMQFFTLFFNIIVDIIYCS